MGMEADESVVLVLVRLLLRQNHTNGHPENDALGA
jgi:hypothetical protein